MDTVELVQALRQAFADAGEPDEYQWLPADPSKAFIVCIGAGPWKLPRREAVQKKALAWLGDRQIEMLTEVNCFPLVWQNRYVSNLAVYLRKTKQSMEAFCRSITKLSHPTLGVQQVHQAVGCKTSKAVSLFCRDFLHVASFPIDRHVQRWLEKYGLPVDEEKMIKLCMKADLDPCKVAKAFFQANFENFTFSKIANPDHRD